MASVLVTGGTGFIGLHLVEALLARGDRVRCLVRPTSNVEPLRSLGAELVTAPLDDVASLKQAAADVDIAFHVAGLIRAFRAGEFYEVNERGTARIAEACAAQAAPPRLVVVSSVAASGPTSRGRLRTEADPPAPISHYGRSKLAGERSIEHITSSLPVTIIRPGIVFGPRDQGFAKIIRTIRRLNVHPSPGFFPPSLSYIHVADLVDLLLRAADRNSLPANSDPPLNRYFAVAPEYPTYAELGRMLRTMLARPRALVIPVASPMAYCIAGISQFVGRLRGKPQELCIDKIRDALAPSWACSGDAARRDFGFQPANSLSDRLQETIDWYSAHRLV